MGFLKFYLVSTAICVPIIFICGLALDAEIKREYNVIEKKRTFFEYVRLYMFVVIPIVNILLTLYSLFGYEYAKEFSIAEGIEDGRYTKK